MDLLMGLAGIGLGLGAVIGSGMVASMIAR